MRKIIICVTCTIYYHPVPYFCSGDTRVNNHLILPLRPHNFSFFIVKTLMNLRLLLCFLLLFGWIGQAEAQVRPPAAKKTQRDTTRKAPILVDYADLLEYVQNDSTIQKLEGNVELRQDSVFMYCDTATIINQKTLLAEGNVIIQQSDSLNVFADSLVYNGRKRIADLYYNVVLVSKDQKLFTDSLNYDLNTKVAKYTTGALLTNDTTQLRSIRGEYFVNTDQAFFKDSVTIVNPDFELKADTLAFNTATQVATFLGPTLINQNGARIYCEAGFYDARNKVAEFRQNAQYFKEAEGQIAGGEVIRYDGEREEVTLRGNAVYIEKDKTARGETIRYNEKTEVVLLEGNASYKDKKQFIVSDTIRYDSKKESFATVGRSRISDPPQILEADQVDYNSETGTGIALGEVVWRDTSADLTIICETATYNREDDFLKATGGRNDRPLLITEIDGDSLFVTADTLFSVRDTFAMNAAAADTLRADTLAQDTFRMLLAYHDVRIFKEDLQAVCDSLTYSDADSIFRFFETPIIWSDTSQFTADSINIELADGEIDRIYLIKNSLMLNSPDNFFFNQIKGKQILVQFDSSEVRTMFVEGNAEAVYYALDDEDAYIGVNKTVCSEMLVYFGNNEVESIIFYKQPSGALQPMRSVDHDKIKLPGFRWEIKKRPKDFDALFENRKSTNTAAVPDEKQKPKGKK